MSQELKLFHLDKKTRMRRGEKASAKPAPEPPPSVEVSESEPDPADEKAADAKPAKAGK